MNIESLRNYCIGKKGVTESFPFDKNTLVFKVKGKIFALANINEFDSINLKCAPSKAIDLRAEFQSIQPGYHMNKNHWNTVYCHAELSNQQIKKLIDDSYQLVVEQLPKYIQKELI